MAMEMPNSPHGELEDIYLNEEEYTSSVDISTCMNAPKVDDSGISGDTESEYAPPTLLSSVRVREHVIDR